MRNNAPFLMAKVIRFPVERRAHPTLALLRELAPNAQEVLAIVAAFDLPDPPPDVRARADADTAREITGGAASPGSLRVLDRLVDSTIARAIVLCWSARDASAAVAEARCQLVQTQKTGVGWLDQRRSRVEMLRGRAADILIEAYIATERAEGIARAAGFIKRGELWVATGNEGDSVTASQASGYKTTLRSRASRKPTLAGAG